jgi:hypothetical protein
MDERLTMGKRLWTTDLSGRVADADDLARLGYRQRADIEVRRFPIAELIAFGISIALAIAAGTAVTPGFPCSSRPRHTRAT